ncbi:methyltransferase domain-containing protein [Paenibacillus sp. OV219]|uniref:methyltransferase domain-containing protein n=1 Tax=Paenibacillus sp. OV219 TaxID=1884377 RepID=UPI0008D67370|nr:methyltransferase domain-containing protein [Paenibacillus sp. OV219]SEO02202.1 Methyltransferase domain-containing protein [Paenibacillus sp. OV219]
MRIDLGCGAHKFHDSYGIDRIAYPGVDLVHDFNERLPMKDHSVSFVMASHSLEYADNLMEVMKELYRVCRHKTIICMVVPYAHVSNHMVNPQFKQLFNEHSPRYWTTSPDRILNEDEYIISQNMSWSAPEIEAENEQPLIDFRLIRMEFFYFPAYNSGFDQQELSLLRQSQLNVANQMMMHLLVVKQPITQAELQQINDSEKFEEPDVITELRETSAAKENKERLFYLDHMQPIIRQQTKKKVDKKVVAKKTNAKKMDNKKTNAKKNDLKKTDARNTDALNEDILDPDTMNIDNLNTETVNTDTKQTDTKNKDIKDTDNKDADIKDSEVMRSAAKKTDTKLTNTKITDMKKTVTKNTARAKTMPKQQSALTSKINNNKKAEAPLKKKSHRSLKANNTRSV